MLDRLFVRLLPLWWIASLADRRWEATSPAMALGLLVILPSIFALAWLIGVVANHAPTQRKPAPSNGLEAWASMPAEELKPPRLMRSIVFALSTSRPSGWWFLLTVAAFVTAGCLLWGLTQDPLPGWLPVERAHADPAILDMVWLAAAATVVLLLVLSWAGEQRARLEPRAPTDDSGWLAFGVLVMILIGVGLIASTFWSGFQWIAVAIGIALIPLTIFPNWRRGTLDVIFGRREPREDEWKK